MMSTANPSGDVLPVPSTLPPGEEGQFVVGARERTGTQ